MVPHQPQGSSIANPPQVEVEPSDHIKRVDGFKVSLLSTFFGEELGDKGSSTTLVDKHQVRLEKCIFFLNRIYSTYLNSNNNYNFNNNLLSHTEDEEFFKKYSSEVKRNKDFVNYKTHIIANSDLFLEGDYKFSAYLNLITAEKLSQLNPTDENLKNLCTRFEKEFLIYNDYFLTYKYKTIPEMDNFRNDSQSINNKLAEIRSD